MKVWKVVGEDSVGLVAGIEKVEGYKWSVYLKLWHTVWASEFGRGDSSDWDGWTQIWPRLGRWTQEELDDIQDRARRAREQVEALRDKYYPEQVSGQVPPPRNAPPPPPPPSGKCECYGCQY